LHRRILCAYGCCGSIRHAVQEIGRRRRRDGSFHPHDDQSIYDALGAAQDFSSRYPLFDSKAISVTSMAIIRRLSLHRSAHDRGRAAAARGYRRRGGSNSAPLRRPVERAIVLRAAPGLLANGARGIAVGMATSIRRTTRPSFDAALHLIDKPDASRRHC
jgi:hypothetical protein